MKRLARFFAARTNGELVRIAGLATAGLAGLTLGALHCDQAELAVIGFAIAIVFGPRLLLPSGRRA